ncbi:hypothetical protein F5051DRAFT_336129 [Lentinula edodes]|nr:hypothetical protein F5051DRAFT_336129 [Lentinula edodes]
MNLDDTASSRASIILDPVQPAQKGAECKGARVYWGPGEVWMTYSFAMHSNRKNRLPWELVHVDKNGTTIYIRAHGCCKVLLNENEIKSGCCNTCSNVPNQRRFSDFKALAAEEFPVTGSRRLEQLTHSQLVAVVRRKTLDHKRLRTKERKIHRLQHKLDDHKQFLMLIATRDIPSLRRIVGITLKQGRSPAAIILQMERAIQGKNLPRSGFNQRDYDKAFLVQALGGPSLLTALHRAEGYPALSTIRKHRPVAKLLPCLAPPTRNDIWLNMNALLDPEVRTPPHLLKSGKLPGVVVMIDGVALEEVCRYDSVRDSVVGICREHCGKIKLRVDSYKALETIADALESGNSTGKCHLGKDGTVLAIATVTDSEHYNPIPLILSPSCKKETGFVLKDWLKLFIQVWREHPYGEAKYGPIQSVASDGELSFSLARFQLCMTEELDPTSALGQIFCKLTGFNCCTGMHNILGTCDYKHIFKSRFKFIFLLSGILVNNTWLSSQDFRTGLIATGLNAEEANDLLDPADKQNVPKAVRLLQNLSSLHELPSPIHPEEQKRRMAINFISDALNFFLQPFIDVTMDLEARCLSLATYAHLTAAMFLRGHLSFLTSALYADSHAIVKNILFTVAKLALDDPSILYYIILNGTDRLEGIFSKVRTQDHNRNFDVLQLSQKLSIAAEIVATLLRNPDLDSGHRRLNLSGAIGIDHINPKSCLGNYRVGDVNIPKLWVQAADAANAILVDAFGPSAFVNFESQFSSPNCDFLRPTSSGYVGSSFEDDEASRFDQSVEEEEGNLAREPFGIDADGFDQEDVLPAGLDSLEDHLELYESMSSDSFRNRFVEVTDETGKKECYLKSSLVRVLCGGEKVRRKVAMRTLHAQGVTMNDFRKKSSKEWDEPIAGEDMMKSGDPAAVLVHIGKDSSTTVTLAVVSVVGFSISGVRGLVSEAPMDHLEIKGSQCPAVVVQILGLTQTSSSQWHWTGEYVRIAPDSDVSSVSSHKQYRFTIPGYLIHPLTVEAVIPSSYSKLSATWRISHQELTDTCQYAWSMLSPDSPETLDEFISNFEMLPTFPALAITNSSLPYQDMNGNYPFNIKSIPSQVLVSKKDGSDEVPCKVCSSRLKLSDMRTHVGAHTLFMLRGWQDPENEDMDPIGPNPCGWCGLHNAGCWTRLVLDPKGKKQPQTESNCEYHYAKMRYSNAAAFSTSSPCTNVPMHCPLCPGSLSGTHRTFWKYNAMYHLLSEHSGGGDEEEGPAYTLPEVPLEFIISTFTSMKEEAALGVDEDATKEYQNMYGIPMSDDLEVLARKRALSDTDNVPQAYKRR